MKPLVSICIANYNGANMIDDCIESVRAQDCGFSYEIIVHDDASTDGSAEHIRASHPDVNLIESTENVGFCVANNRMVAVALGAYILLLNNDAALMPDALATLHDSANQLDHPAILGIPQYDLETKTLLDIGSFFDPFLNPIPNRSPDHREVGMIMGACLWIPRDLWDELGGFPDWFGSIAEDLYLCCIARLAGYPVIAVSHSGYLHHVGASFGGGKVSSNKRLATTYQRRALSERNKTYAIIVTYPLPMLLPLLPLHLVAVYLEGILLAFVKNDWTLWQSIYRPLLPSIWRKRWHLYRNRKTIQARRTISTSKFLKTFRIMPRKLQLLSQYGLPTLHKKADAP